jgi:PKD repeat protein
MKSIGLLVCVALSLPGCGEQSSPIDAAVSPPDFGGDDLSWATDVGAPVRAGFTITGCQTLDFSDAAPHCTGSAPLRLTFIPLIAGATSFFWTFDGASVESSKDVSPTVDFLASGTFAVTLAVGGAAGSAAASGQVVVTTGALGQSCLHASDCDTTAALVCICGEGASCPAPLEGGLCTRPCIGGSCGGKGLCADFGRAAPISAGENLDAGVAVDGGSEAESYRQPLCVPSCTGDLDCRPGFLCRALPALETGAVSGGPYQFERGCFPPGVLGDDGDACADASGAPDDARCLSGHCEPFGARGVCTSDCSDSSSCPSGTACLTMNDSMAHLCLLRCGGGAVCDDPLLGCEAAGAGGLGFSAPAGEPTGATYCAPRRCMSSDDCGPAGACTPVAGASFCIKN